MGCETAKSSTAQAFGGVCSTETQRDKERTWQDGGQRREGVWPHLLSLLSGPLAGDEPSFVGYWVCVIVFGCFRL